MTRDADLSKQTLAAPLRWGRVRFGNVVTRILTLLIDLYRHLISPLLPVSCRFDPTCSVYARDAVRKHGAWCGAKLAVWRILRCNPWCSGGVDPVP